MGIYCNSAAAMKALFVVFVLGVFVGMVAGQKFDTQSRSVPEVHRATGADGWTGGPHEFWR